MQRLGNHGGIVGSKLSIVALTALVGCRGHEVSHTAAAGSHTPMTDSVAAQAQNLLCRDTTPNHPDPGKLVREYVRRDGGGEFLSSNTFWVSATECAEGGADVARVITSSSIDSLGIRADTARFAVTYHFLGDLLQGPVGFAPNVRTQTDTFVVIRRPYGWRIVGPHGMPIMMREAARRFWPLTRADLARLDSAARVAPN
jgi:hypothetical protein